MPQITDPRSVDYRLGASAPSSDIPLWLRPAVDWWEEQQRKLREWQAQQANPIQDYMNWRGEQTAYATGQTPQSQIDFARKYQEQQQFPNLMGEWGALDPQLAIEPRITQMPNGRYVQVAESMGLGETFGGAANRASQYGKIISSALPGAQKAAQVAKEVAWAYGIGKGANIEKAISALTANQVATRLTKVENPIFEVVKLLQEGVPRQTIYEALTTKAKSIRTFATDVAQDMLRTAEDHLAQIKGVVPTVKPPVSAIAEMPPVAETVLFTHYSNVPGLKKLNPEKMGTGAGMETLRGGVEPVTHLYPAGATPEPTVAGGRYLYKGSFPAKAVLRIDSPEYAALAKRAEQNVAKSGNAIRGGDGKINMNLQANQELVSQEIIKLAKADGKYQAISYGKEGLLGITPHPVTEVMSPKPISGTAPSEEIKALEEQIRAAVAPDSGVSYTDIEKLRKKLRESREGLPAVAKAPEAAVTGQKPPVEPPPAPGPAPAGPPPEGPRPPATMAEDPIKWFGDMLISPKTEKLRDVSLELRKRAFASKISAFQNRTEQLILDGQSIEDAIKQATTETMSGKMPDVTNTVFDDVTREMSDALFAKMYKVLADDPVELLSTTEALTNAMLGKSIPRVAGIKGGSAYTRLLRVFGDNPAILEALDKPKPLKAVIEDLFYGAKPPADIDQEVANYLRNLPNRPYQQGETWLSGQAAMDLGGVPYKPPVEAGLLKESQPWDIPGVANDPRTKDQRILDFLFETKKETPIIGESPPETPVGKIVKQQLPGMPTVSQNLLVRALKYAGLTIGDIGNMIRAGKASGDFSFWRQQAPMILAHPKRFAEANVKAFKALFDAGVAKESWQRITQDPLYGLYEELGLDFIRPAMGAPGIPEWRLVEEFGYSGANRPISKLTEKLPWVEVSQRSFTTGTNEHNWAMFKDFYLSRLKYAEEIASGVRKLKPGETVNIRRDLKEMGKMLGDFSGRGSLGKARAIASTLSGVLFAPRMVMGRIMTPRHLFSPSPAVRKEAWKNLSTFVGGIGSVLVAGKQAGWWDVETDPRNADFAKIRVGNTRFDPWGGYQQYVTFAARLLSGTGVSSVTGETYPIDPTSAIARLAESKSAPLLSIMTEMYTGKTFLGEKIDYGNLKQWADRLGIPMAWMQIGEAFAENTETGIASIIPSLVGVGVQSYVSPTSPSVIKQQILDSAGINIPAAEKKPTGLETFQNQLTPAEYDTALQYYGTTYKERVAEFTNSGAEIDNVWTPYAKMTDEDKKKQLDKISSDVQEDMVLRYTKNLTPAQKTRIVRKAAQKVLDADYDTIPGRVWEPLEKVWPGIHQTSDYYQKLDEGGTPAEKKLAAQWFQGTDYGRAALKARRDIANAKLNVRKQYPEVGAAYDLIYGR